MRALPPVLLLLLSACGWPEDRYFEEKTAARCERIITCEYGVIFNYDDEDACVEGESEKAEAAEAADCADYDGRAAKACVEGIALLECDEFLDDEAYPEECDQICSNTSD